LDVRDYCKLHIVSHCVAKLLAADEGRFAVVPLGKIGDDAAGAFVLREMRAVGIDTRFVKKVSGSPTLFSVCFQYPDGSGGNITTSNSAAAELTEQDIDEGFSVLEFDPKTIALLVPEVPLASRSHFLGLAKPKGCFCVASFVSGELAEAKKLGMFDHLDLVSLNEEETAQFVGEAYGGHGLEHFVDKLRVFLSDRYPHLHVIMSAGQHGAYFVDPVGWSHSAAPAVDVASTAGAGDCLLGGFLAALAAGIPLPSADERHPQKNLLANALAIGVLLASYKVSSPHTIHPHASLDELLRFAKQLGMSIAPRIGQFIVESEPVRTAP
jgi:sugar/nucleoside kinase (ribokinase family)